MNRLDSLDFSQYHSRMISAKFTVLCIFGLAAAIAAAVPAPGAPEIRISDVELFYRVYDAAGGKPTAEQLQRDYLTPGSAGLHEFLARRIRSAEVLAKKIAQDPAPYEKARECMAALPDVQARLAVVLPKLKQLLPEAKFPPVTILIGRNSAAGIPGEAGVMMGLERACTGDWWEPNVSDRLVHLISHEYIHIQQPDWQNDENGGNSRLNVLAASLSEGVAEFGGELISGSVGEVHLQRWLAGCDSHIAVDFLRDADSLDTSSWLSNGPGTAQRPGDIGYWVGYRIAKAYYARANNKREAFENLIRLDNPKAILRASGWPKSLPGGAAHETCNLGTNYFPEPRAR
jgi:Predicted Zn-dependent protease (DUF2268)